MRLSDAFSGSSSSCQSPFSKIDCSSAFFAVMKVRRSSTVMRDSFKSASLSFFFFKGRVAAIQTLEGEISMEPEVHLLIFFLRFMYGILSFWAASLVSGNNVFYKKNIFADLSLGNSKRVNQAADSNANFVGMAQHVISNSNSWVPVEPDAWIQDGGNSTFLAGSEYVLRYLKWLELIGMDVEHLHFKRCDKSFKFGGDGESVSRWMVQLPAKLGDKVGRIHCFVIFGATPMLLGRPILKCWMLWLTLVVKGWVYWVVTGKKSATEKVAQCFWNWLMESLMAHNSRMCSSTSSVRMMITIRWPAFWRHACRKSLCPNDVVVTNAKHQHQNVLLMPLTWKRDMKLTMEPICEGGPTPFVKGGLEGGA